MPWPDCAPSHSLPDGGGGNRPPSGQPNVPANSRQSGLRVPLAASSPRYLALTNIRRRSQSLPAATEDRHRPPSTPNRARTIALPCPYRPFRCCIVIPSVDLGLEVHENNPLSSSHPFTFPSRSLRYGPGTFPRCLWYACRWMEGTRKRVGGFSQSVSPPNDWGVAILDGETGEGRAFTICNRECRCDCPLLQGGRFERAVPAWTIWPEVEPEPAPMICKPLAVLLGVVVSPTTYASNLRCASLMRRTA